MASNRNTISHDDYVCRWIEEGVGALNERNIDEDDNMCTDLWLDQSYVGNCNE